MKLAKRVRPLLRHHEDIEYFSSRPYPYVFAEDLRVGVAMKGAGIPYEFHPVEENVSASVSITGALLRDTLTKLSVTPENVSASVSITGALLRDTLTKLSAAPENVSASVSITGALLKNVLITNGTQPENVAVAVSIQAAVLKDN